jgi:hypothetical protein
LKQSRLEKTPFFHAFFMPGNQRVLFLIKSPVSQLEKERVTQEKHFMNVDVATCMPAEHG